MRVLISGLYGHMGQHVLSLVKEGYEGAVLSGGIDVNAPYETEVPCAKTWAEANELAENTDVIVDFSFHTVTPDLLNYAIANKLPLVIATTGQTEEERNLIRQASEKIPVFFAANYSMGIALLAESAKRIASVMNDAEIEIVEMHHDRKADAPSGTALSLAREIQSVRTEATLVTGRSGFGKRTKEEIGISSVRMGNIVGVHEVMIGNSNEMITLKHEAFSRAMFAEGALKAAAFLCDKPAGLYEMKNLFAE